MEGEAFVAGEPLAHLWMLVCCIIVEDHMHGFTGRNFSLNSVQKSDKFLMTLPRKNVSQG